MKNTCRKQYSFQFWIISIFWSTVKLDPDISSDCNFISVSKKLWINCTSRHLKTIPQIEFKMATSVNLSHNDIESLHMDENQFIDLKILDLSYNSIQEISGFFFLKRFPNLEILKLEHNKLTALPTYFPKKLNFVEMSYNEIKVVDLTVFTNIRNLQSLFLDFNLIRDIVLQKTDDKDVTETTKLIYAKKLSLCNNFLRDVASDTFLSLVNIEYLDLGWNNIEHFEPNSFKNNVNLKYLGLSHNSLSYLPEGLPMLEWLDISFNKITKILEYQSHEVYPQEIILLGGNPFHCDCELLWLKEFYNTRKYLKTIVKADPSKFVPSCVGPPGNVGKSWDILQDSEFGCGVLDSSVSVEPGGGTKAMSSWKLEELFVKIKEIGDTFIKITWNSVKSMNNVLLFSLHPFGEKHLQKKTLLDPNIGKYHIKNLVPKTPYIICISMVTVDDKSYHSNMAVSVDDCHEIVTMATVIDGHFLHSIFLSICFFIFSVIVYYFSLWVHVLSQFYSWVQFLQADFKTQSKRLETDSRVDVK